MDRSLGELRIRVHSLLLVSQELRDECMKIAREKSPSAAFDLASLAARQYGFAGMQTISVAKATRWLSVIRRDHGEQVFDEVVRTLTSTTPTS